ncbi:MAG: hypothetical protein WCG25_07080 [bacterium]
MIFLFSKNTKNASHFHDNVKGSSSSTIKSVDFCLNEKSLSCIGKFKGKYLFYDFNISSISFFLTSFLFYNFLLFDLHLKDIFRFV